MAKSVKSIIQEVRALLHADSEGFYLSGTTTSAGTVTTFIASGLSHATEALNEKVVKFNSGTNQGMKREIAYWDSATKTGTMHENLPLPAAVDSGVSFEIAEGGFFDDFEIVDWILEGASFVFRAAREDVLTEHLKDATASGTPVSGVNYGKVTLPADRRGIMKHVEVDAVEVPIYLLSEWDEFVNSPFVTKGFFIHSSVEAYFKPKPSVSAVVRFRYIEVPVTLLISDTVTWPDKIIDAIKMHAVAMGWMKKEKPQQAESARKSRDEKIQIINALGE